jgi:mono/diheme cytochrome c family protein
MPRTRTIGVLACSLLLAAVASPPAPLAADDSFAAPSRVANILRKHCMDCHGDGSAEGDVQLDALATLGADERLALLARVQEQLHLHQMPPDGEPQPSDQDKEQLSRWLASELAKAGRGTALAQKLQRPEFGNYVDHDKLFSGEIKTDPFSPARLWRRSPYHFDSAKRTYFGVHRVPSQTIGEVDELKQPFHASDAEGIGDYAALFYADSATFDTLFRNAEFVVDRTLLMAFIEYDYTSRGKTLDDWKADRDQVLKAQQDEIEQYQQEGKTTRYIGRAHAALNAKYKLETPPVYRDIILGDGQPTQAQIEAAIRHHFHRIGLHEPTREDIDKYTRFMEDGIAQAGPYFGLRNVLIAILVSPQYIYRSELGLGRPVGDGRTMLAPIELAYAISYALTDDKPDETLLEAAQSGRLQTREDVRREVVRLLEDARIAKPRMLRFFHEFFGYHRAPEVFKDDARFHGGFTFHKIAERYVADTDLLVLHILEKDRNVFQELLSTEEFFVGHSGDNAAVKAEVDAHEKLYAYFQGKPWRNYAASAKQPEQPSEADVKYARSLHPTFKDLNGDGIHGKMRMLTPFAEKGITPFTYSAKRSRDAQFKGLMAYNIDGYHWDFPVAQPFVLDAGKRAGILSHPSWLIAHSLNATTDPVRRGKWIRERLLAGTIPDVPITVDASVPEDPHKTLRERYAVTEAQACWKCHVKMNPLGYAFEMFDDFGRWRDRENMESLPREGNQFQTKPIHTQGWLDGTGDESLDGEVTDAIDLVNRLAKSRRAQQSFIRHAFRYWMGRNELLSDSKTLIAAEEAYMAGGGSFRALLTSLLTSDSFLYRKPLD